MGSDATEFVNRVNDEVRKRQKIFQRCRRMRRTFYYLGNVYGCDDECSDIFMGKNFQDNQNSIMNTADLTLKKMIDISAKLVSEQDEIFKVDTIPWEKHSWKYLSLIGDEAIINLQSFQILCCVLEGSINIRSPTKLGKTG